MATAAQREGATERTAGAPPETALWYGDSSRMPAPSDAYADSDDIFVTCWRTEPATEDAESRSATEYVAAAGMPGRGIVLVSLLGGALSAGTDLGLTGGLTLFFDLCFVTICLIGAMAIRRADLFTAGVLAPLVLAAVILVVSVIAPRAFVVGGDISQVFLTGLAQHAGALVAGYGVALATVAGRVAAARV